MFFISVAPGNHWPFCLSGFAYSGPLIWMESCNVWPFVAGCFYLVCFQGWSILWHIIKKQLFIPFCCRIIFHCVDVPYFNYSLVGGHLCCFCFLSLMMLWTFLCRFLCGHMFSVFLAVYTEAELLGHMVIMCNILKNCHTAEIIFWRDVFISS